MQIKRVKSITPKSEYFQEILEQGTVPCIVKANRIKTSKTGDCSLF